MIAELLYNQFNFILICMLIPLLILLSRQFIDKLFIFILLSLIPFFLTSAINLFDLYLSIFEIEFDDDLFIGIAYSAINISFILCPFIGLLKIIKVQFKWGHYILISLLIVPSLVESIFEYGFQRSSVIMSELLVLPMISSFIFIFILGFKKSKTIHAKRIGHLFYSFFFVFLYSIVYEIVDSIFDIYEGFPVVDIVFGENAITLAISITVFSFLWKNYFKKNGSHQKSIPERFFDHYKITNREKQIIEFIVSGETSKQIAEQLFITQQTVKNHVYKIYQKLDVNNKVEMVNRILESKKFE